MARFKASLRPLWQEIKTFWHSSWKRFLLISLILTLAYSAIILASSYYWDDIFREIQGFRGWQDFSRYANNYLAIVFNTSGRLIDISPLTHFIAIAFLSLSCCILIYLFKVKLFNKKPTFFDIIASIIIALSPYYLECFVYKFDSPYMAISVFASILPFLFLGASKLGFYSSAFLGTLLMCTTYQASSGIFPLLVIFASLAFYHNGKSIKEILKFIGASALCYLAAIFIFKTFLMAPIDPNYASYVGNSVFPLGQLIPGFFNNLSTYYHYIFSDFRTLWLILIVALIASFIIFSTISSERKKIPALLISLFATAIILILPFGLYPALENTTFDPRAFLGFGAAIAFFCLYISSLSRALPGKLLATSICYCFIVFSFVYGNALRQQDSWNYFRTSTLANNLSELNIMSTDEEKIIAISGSIGLATPIQNYANATGCGILERLSFVALQDSTHSWGYYYLLNYFGLPNLTPDKDQTVIENPNLEVVKDTVYHRISVADNQILVELK